MIKKVMAVKQKEDSHKLTIEFVPVLEKIECPFQPTLDHKIGDFFSALSKYRQDTFFIPGVGRIGYEILLDKRFRDYPEVFNPSDTTKIRTMLSIGAPSEEIRKLHFPLAIYESGRSWPPFDNFSGIDPINSGEFGAADNNPYPPKEKNNSFLNIIVLEFPSGAKTGYNSVALIQALRSNQFREPTTGLRLSPESLANIASLLPKLGKEVFPTAKINFVV